MEIESSSEESTSSSQEPRAFHFEDFCLFLACNLVGEKTLEEEWAAKDSLGGFSATWKSPLLIKVDPVTMERVDNSDDGSTADLVYVTVSFLFEANQMSVFFGAFIHQKESYYYHEGEHPITEQYLQDHVEQHDVVMEDTKSFAIANAMTKALWQLNKQQSEKGGIKILQGSKEEIKIPLMYGEGDPSYLILSTTTKPTPVDPVLAKHLIRDCLFQGKKQTATPPKFAAEDTEKLVSMYLEWKDKANDKIKEAAKKKAKEQEKEAADEAVTVEKKALPQKEAAAPTTTENENTQKDAPPPKAKKKTKKKPMVHGFVMQKRKKAKK